MSELLDLAAKVAGGRRRRGAGRGVRGPIDHDVGKVHGGAIESLTQATSAGIGVRVIDDGRQGFAWAGSLDDDVVAEVAGRGP